MEDQFATLTATDDEGEEKVLEELGTLKSCPECGVMISKNGGVTTSRVATAALNSAGRTPLSSRLKTRTTVTTTIWTVRAVPFDL